MKILLVSLAVLLIIYLVLPTKSSNASTIETGDFATIERLISRLFKSDDEVSFLIIRNIESNEFLQITTYKSGSQIDFPLITEGQKALEKSIKDASNDLKLPFHITTGSDGSLFLDIEVYGGPKETILAVKFLLKTVFRDSYTNKFELQYAGT